MCVYYTVSINTSYSLTFYIIMSHIYNYEYINKIYNNHSYYIISMQEKQTKIYLYIQNIIN